MGPWTEPVAETAVRCFDDAEPGTAAGNWRAGEVAKVPVGVVARGL